MSDTLGSIPGASPLVPATVSVDVPGVGTLEVDAATAAMLKSAEITIQVTRADGTVEEPMTMRTEFAAPPHPQQS